MYNYSTLSKLIHCLVSLTCTKFNLQNSGIVVFRTNDVVLCKRYVTKILWLKKLICTSWIRMLWKTDCKVLVWHNILFLIFFLCWVIYAFCLEQYWTKIFLLFQDLMLKLLIRCNLPVLFSRIWNLFTCFAMQFKSTRALKSICWQRVRFHRHHLSRVEGEEGVGACSPGKLLKNEIAKMCISLI